MSKFSLTKNINTVGELQKVQEEILNRMPEEILFTKSKEEICGYILNEFDFPVSTINIMNSSSLEEGCKTILGLIGLDEDSEIELVFGREKKIVDKLDKLLYYVLDFNGLPGIYKEQLEVTVRNDLEIISNYIAEYQKIDFINKGETPRNHNQRTQNDFFNRCIEEKAKIETHLASGINERALSKARRDNMWGLTMLMFEEFRDRPYKVPMPKSKQYFDLESIDKVGHRLGEIPISKGRELKAIYKTDKAIFYKELEKLIPDIKVLGSMIQQLKFLPYVTEERKLIFDELLELYNTKKVFGFYALALTQIEGLFTEMCRMCEPQYDSPYAALPDKVNTVRPYHPYSDSRFDYFQYHLPNLRNRFLHFGIDKNEKIEILCKEILYDLEEVISIFSTLTIDANRLLRLIRKRDDTEFMRIQGLCFYFRMLNSVKTKNQFHYFEAEIKDLNKIFIPEIVYNVFYDMDARIEALIETIYEPIKIQSNSNGFAVDLNTITLKEIAGNKGRIKKALNEIFTWQMKSEIEELLAVWYFLNSYKKYLELKFISTEVQGWIENIKTKYCDILKKINLISLNTDLKMGN